MNPQLPETTAQWLAGLPKHGNPVGAVWARLVELKHAGQDSAAIAALRTVLLRNQPPQPGRCPASPGAAAPSTLSVCRVHRAHLELFSPRVFADQGWY
jgi:hypothetical protein